LCKSDPLVVTTVSESGDHEIGAAGELHMEICLKDLEEDHAQCELIKTDPIVTYRESILGNDEPFTSLSKSPNKHNRLYCHAVPLTEELSADIDAGENDVTHKTDFKKRANYLADTYGWEKGEAQKIWCYGPEGSGPNIFLDGSKAVQYLNDIKDSVVSGFQWFTKCGALAEENMRGVCVKLTDATLHADAIHRGAGQILGTCRRVCMATQLRAKPRLVEPYFLVEIECPMDACKGCYSVVSTRRGTVFDSEPLEGGQMQRLKAHLPVAESFGFTAHLRSQTGGQAFPQCVFDHWEALPSDPLESGTPAYEAVQGILTRKGISQKDVTHYEDKL